MWRMVGSLGTLIRTIGSGIDAAHAIKLGLPLPEQDRMERGYPAGLPWAGAGPAQPGRIWPAVPDQLRRRV